METRSTTVLGCLELHLDPVSDHRGQFVKLFQASSFAALGVELAVREIFWSRSPAGVVRGLHFQGPPADVAKLVCCPEGAVLDVVVDLRVDSPTYRCHAVVDMTAGKANAVFVPHGCAHGFLVTEDALVVYAQSGEWDPDHEGGILWSSVDVDWPVDTDQAVLSERDAQFPALDGFASPFWSGSAPEP